MARIEEDACVGVCERCAELADLLIESDFVEIDAVNHLESEPSQRGRQFGGVILGISKLSGELVAGVADHERHALLRMRDRRKQEQHKNGADPQHIRLPRSRRNRRDELKPSRSIPFIDAIG